MGLTEDDYPPEYEILDVYDEEEITEEEFVKEKEIPDVFWAEDIENISDVHRKRLEMERADIILVKEDVLDRRLESGEITEDYYMSKYENGIALEKINAASECAIHSGRLSYTDLGDPSRGYDIPELAKEEVEEKKKELGRSR
jgi:peptide subunit release factor 1 (eRF1)